MNVAPSTSAANLINAAQHKSADAAHVIATLPVQKDEVGSAEFNAGDITKPILSLKEAELETSAAVKVLEADKKMVGAILDIRA
ncbi:MAG: hypothetical protein WC762_04910 [Methylobacter sp.]|jgi:hypothetical protein